VPILEEYASDYEYRVKENGIKRPLLPRDMLQRKLLNGVTLRDYQLAALKELTVHRNGVAHMATNSGKTLIIAALCQLVNGRCLILTHKKELLYQLSEVVQKTTGLDVGLVGDGYKNLDQLITVATMQTLSKMLGTSLFQDFAISLDGLFIDECHHTSAKTMYDIVMRVPATWRFGFSGTPKKEAKLANLQLRAATGPVRVRISNEQLIQDGYSAKPKITMHKLPEGTKEEHDMSYYDAYKEFIVEAVERNRICVEVATKAVKSGKVVLIIVEQIRHMNLLKASLTAARIQGIKCVFVNGGHTATYRNKILKEMRTGKPGIYVATSIFEEGVDVPALDMVILAAGGKSHVKLLQRIGRGLRKKEGDNVVDIIDFYDAANKHLIRHSDYRLGIYKSEGFKVQQVAATT
jgi:superfamily II DNA or RNA helicase